MQIQALLSKLNNKFIKDKEKAIREVKKRKREEAGIEEKEGEESGNAVRYAEEEGPSLSSDDESGNAENNIPQAESLARILYKQLSVVCAPSLL